MIGVDEVRAQMAKRDANPGFAVEARDALDMILSSLSDQTMFTPEVAIYITSIIRAAVTPEINLGFHAVGRKVIDAKITNSTTLIIVSTGELVQRELHLAPLPMTPQEWTTNLEYLCSFPAVNTSYTMTATVAGSLTPTFQSYVAVLITPSIPSFTTVEQAQAWLDAQNGIMG